VGVPDDRGAEAAMTVVTHSVVEFFKRTTEEFKAGGHV
jgi:hypothetical protein